MPHYRAALIFDHDIAPYHSLWDTAEGKIFEIPISLNLHKDIVTPQNFTVQRILVSFKIKQPIKAL